MRISTPMRAGRRPVKRLDLRDMRKVLEDQRMWCAVGKVIAPDGEDGAPHFELVPGETGSIVDILVEVVLLPGNEEVTCRLGGASGGRGVLTVPAVGAEVAIIVPNGAIDWMPIIVCTLSAGDVPNPAGQGPSTSTTVIMDTNVLIHDGTGGAEPLVKRSEFNGHTHGPGSFITPSSGGGGGPVSGVSDGAANVTGTEVLLAK